MKKTQEYRARAGNRRILSCQCSLSVQCVSSGLCLNPSLAMSTAAYIDVTESGDGLTDSSVSGCESDSEPSDGDRSLDHCIVISDDETR